MNMIVGKWGEDVVSRIEALALTRRYTASGIAQELCASGVVMTRNAVIGICNRRGFKLGKARGPDFNAPRKPKASPAPRRRFIATGAASSEPEAPAVASPSMERKPDIIEQVSPVSIDELSDSKCRWPLGGFADEPPYMYCGDVPLDGCPYCASHQKLATSHRIAPLSIKHYARIV